MDRRQFIKKTGVGAAVAAGIRFPNAFQNFDASPVKMGFVGVGSRGYNMLSVALSTGLVQVTAVCDILPERVERAQKLVERAGQPKPEGFIRGPEDYKRLAEKQDLDAVYTATPLHLHAPVMLAAMRNGKYGGTEMPACLSIEEGWELVETSEKTGMPCMLMENYCYMRDVQMVLNMVQQGALGEITHCETGYQHDTRYVNIDSEGNLLWRAHDKIKHNGNRYPTHAIGPVAQWINVNRGDRFEYLVSMSSKAAGLKAYATKHFGPNHPSANQPYKTGDVNTTLIRTVNGISICLYYDTMTPRPVDFIWRVQGTKGIHSGTLKKVHLDGVSPAHQWEDTTQYLNQYDHPNWKTYAEKALKSGHGGSDFLCMLDFATAIQNRKNTPIDVYDAATWSCITELTEISVNERSRPVDFPDFTKGKWKTRKPLPIAAI